MRNKSNLLVGISVVLMIFLCLSSLFILILTKSIQQDAKMINHTGVIRGSIQRIAKLELSQSIENNIKSDQQMKSTDDLIKKLGNSKWAKVGKYTDSFDKLSASWIEMKILVASHRQNFTPLSQQAIMVQSEIIWRESNTAVDNAQFESERKILHFNLILMVFLVNIFLIIVIIVLLRSYVQKNLEIAANHDSLTGIYNRAFLYGFLNKVLNDIVRYPKNLSIITFDIDHFKKVNDTFGHGVGDLVLKEITKIISDNIRSSDVFARIGGEEFLIALPNTDLEGAMELSEKIRSRIDENKFVEAGHITISLGITIYKKDDTLDDLFKRADDALYKAKNNGRNRIEFE